jgi:hypothetical protein
MRLAIGILKLEGTDKAVTAEQAKTLLPLWKGMKAEASTKENYPQAEVDGLDKQIREALTPDQVTAIDALDLSQQNMRTVFSGLGFQGGNGQNNPNDSSNGSGQPQANTSQGGGPQGGGPQSGGSQGSTTNRQRNGQGTTGRTFTGGGGFTGGGFNGGTQTGSGTRSSAQGSGSSQANANTAHRLPTALLNAVIDLLTKRAAA